MYIDYIQCEDYFDLGYSKVYKVKIKKINNKQDLKKLKDELNIIQGCKLNQDILSSKNVDILVSPELYEDKDSLHERNSGLNHILCKLAKKNNIIIAFSFSDILKADSKLLGKIMQNIKLCRKYKVRTLIASFASSKFEMRSPYDLKALFETLGMMPNDIKKSLSIDLIKEKKEYITEGIRLLE